MKKFIVSLGMVIWMVSFVIGIYQFTSNFKVAHNNIRNVQNVELS